MPKEIILAALSADFEVGTLEEWHVKVGDTISVGDLIADISTDKAVVEIEALDAGTIGKILVAAGTEDVPVDTVIAILLLEGETIADIDNETAAVDAAAPPEKKSSPAVSVSSEAGEHAVANVDESRQFVSPNARRRASEMQVDLAGVEGSGPAGRVVGGDIDAIGASAEFVSIPNDNVRKIIARRMTHAKQTVPHFYLTIDCQIDALLTLRKQLNTKSEMQGEETKLSVNDFVIAACAAALRDVPAANSSWTDDAIRQFNDVDISVAVATPKGLMTPVIRRADTLSLPEISAGIKDLATRARAGKLKPGEFKGGSFTISNLGMYGIREFSAIINPPQSCILAIGAAEERAIVKAGRVEVASVMTCTLSVDHRAVDGGVGAEFLQAFKEKIENPEKLESTQKQESE